MAQDVPDALEGSATTRRGLLKGGMAVGLGIALGGLAGPAYAAEYQSNWRWCNRCQGLAYGGNVATSRCPAGGRHNHSGSGNYILAHVDVPGKQSGWRWCNRCQGLFYAGGSTTGACPAGGGHNYGGSYEYRVPFEPATGQRGWRWCNRSQGLFYGDNVATSRCPVGGRHTTAGSGAYVLASID
jgi:hypothetical protein